MTLIDKEAVMNDKNEKQIESEYLTPEQIAKEFGISTSKQSKLRMRRRQEDTQSIPFPFYKIDKTILYKRNEIVEWIEKHKVKKEDK